jgi:hypothetical protein
MNIAPKSRTGPARAVAVEATPTNLSVATDRSHDPNGLRESFRTFRRNQHALPNGSQNLNGLLESFRTFRSTPAAAATGSRDLLRESLRTFRSTPPAKANRSRDWSGLRESLRTFRRGVANHRPNGRVRPATKEPGAA